METTERQEVPAKPEPRTWWPVLLGCGALLLLAALALFTFVFFVGHKQV